MHVNVSFTIPGPAALVRSWRWFLLMALVLAVTVTAGSGPARAAFPGANGKIAFVSYRNGNPEIYVMNADGSGQIRLTNNSADDGAPAWSPDGTKIAFHSDRDGNYEVYVMNADGSGQTRLTNNAADDASPAWSPDGTKIAFGNSGSEIYVMNADGSGQTRLTSNAAQPAWSPDGTKIAFDSNGKIYVMNADGSGPTRLTNNAADDFSPAWSPAGTKIAFSSTRDGNYEVYVMNADGTGQTNLTNNAAFDLGPAWSPDGTKIAFFSDRSGNNSVIYSMNADGTGQTQLTNAGHFYYDDAPDWQPVAPRLNITNIGQYALPKACFQVRNSSQTPLFTICDNNFQGSPESNAACVPDGVCLDVNPARGAIGAPVVAGDYRVVESAVPPNHTAVTGKQACDATVTECSVTFTNTPLTQPWFPWDIVSGDGSPGVDGGVYIEDIVAVVEHYFQSKPLP